MLSRLRSVRPVFEELECRLTPASLPAGFSETVAAVGLNNATAMEIAPDGRLFVAEQGGTLRVVQNGRLLPTPFVSLSVNSSGERGLLGLAFDPNFASNNFIYLYYTTASSPIHNRLSRFTANGNVVVPGSEVPLLDLETLGATNHNGGAVHFGNDGKLYLAVGENAVPSNAQNLDTFLGKVLRLNPDGSFPTDNPFYTTATAKRSAVFALGFRNPFTFGVQPTTGRIFINDVGSGGSVAREEINDLIAGSNYGWPTVEGVAGNPNFRDPLYAFDHSGGVCSIAGGAFYNPATAQFPSDYTGDYFFADLCAGWIKRFDPATSTVTDFATGTNFPVDLKVGSDGSLFYLSRGGGAVYRVSYNAAPANTSTFLADWNNDNVADLISIRGGATLSGVTEVDILNGANNFQSYLLHTPTALHAVDGTWAFSVADHNRDGRPDIVGIKKANTGSNRTEVHVLDGASSFQAFSLHIATVLHPTGTDFDFQAIDFNGDSFVDVVAFKKANTGSNSTEIHVLNGATTFQSFLFQTATGLHPTGAEAALSLADINRDGALDLVYVKKFNTGSGRTEIHALSGATGFQTFNLHAATALGTTGAESEFRLRDLNGDSVLDLVQIQKNGASGQTELHVLNGAANFGVFFLDIVTALPKSA